MVAHVFDYGQKRAADQMKVTYEKIVQRVGTIYGQDISNELQNRKKIILDPPEYTQEIKDTIVLISIGYLSLTVRNEGDVEYKSDSSETTKHDTSKVESLISIYSNLRSRLAANYQILISTTFSKIKMTG